jgi:type I restriction enzyme S subunit
MVVREKPDVVLREFLPFLMMSDKFMNRAVEISVGSLSPTINWTTLKLEEFDLPPLDQQRRIAEILWVVDQEEQRKADLESNVRRLLTAILEEELDRLFDGPCKSLSEVLLGSPESGKSAPPSPRVTGHFVLSLAALSRNGYVRGNLKPVSPTKPMLDCRLLVGDFLISRSNTQELVGHVGIFDEERNDVSFPDTMMRLPVNEAKVSKRFLEVVLQSRRGRRHMMRSAAGTSGSMKKINRRTLGTCLIPTPTLNVQERLLRKLQHFREAANSLNAGHGSANAMKLALIESFNGVLK